MMEAEAALKGAGLDCEAPLTVRQACRDTLYGKGVRSIMTRNQMPPMDRDQADRIICLVPEALLLKDLGADALKSIVEQVQSVGRDEARRLYGSRYSPSLYVVDFLLTVARAHDQWNIFDRPPIQELRSWLRLEADLFDLGTQAQKLSKQVEELIQLYDGTHQDFRNDERRETISPVIPKPVSKSKQPAQKRAIATRRVGKRVSRSQASR